MKKTYSEHFLDPKWQQFRLKRLEQADWSCDKCLSADSTLHVHHLFYIPGRKPWEYLPGTTLVLCDKCHDAAHKVTSFSKWERLVEEATTVDRCFDGGMESAIEAVTKILIPEEWLEKAKELEKA